MDIDQQTPAARDLSHYLRSEDFADAILCFGGLEQRVHRIVLAQGSDYFSTLFLSSFKEAHGEPIVLTGDDPRAIKNLIVHLYGEEVLADDICCSEEGFEEVKLQIEMYIAGSKYLVPSICAEIEEAFPNNLVRLLGQTDTELEFTYIDKIARVLYLEHDVAAQSLQPPLIALLAAHATELTRNAKFRELNVEIPELAFDLLTLLAQPKKLLKLKKKKV